MDNTEILRRFDVLYNNITSSQAPGLDGYEKSVFWNKASLEVLKNHLNPKGNKYGEGYDGSTKRQVDFSTLTVNASFSFPVEKQNDTYNSTAWRTDEEVEDNSIDFNNVLCVINESLTVLSAMEAAAFHEYMDNFVRLIFSGSGRTVTILTQFIQFLKDANVPEDHPLRKKLAAAVEALVGDTGGTEVDLSSLFDNTPTIDKALLDARLSPSTLVVVPLNYVEYDTVMSRPYKFPPKSQAWRVLTGSGMEFIQNEGVPVQYKVRYIRTPKEVDLTNPESVCELPASLHEEVLQRAVELAKAAYVGDMNHQQLIQVMGERSE